MEAIMANKVKVKKSQVDYFRKQARESPFEIQAFLIGQVVSPTLTVVDYFAYPKQYAFQKTGACAWYVSEYEQVKKEAEERGRRVVGFIHSHPQWDAVLSPQDYEICISDMHRICGICSTEGRKTRVRFWVMDSALPCDIVYETKKRTQEGPQ